MRQRPRTALVPRARAPRRRSAARLAGGACKLGFGRRELTADRYEVLVGARDATVRWRPAKSPFAVRVPVGEEKGQPFFAARARIGGGLFLGKIRGDWTKASILFEGTEIEVDDFEVLTAEPLLAWAASKNGAVPANAWSEKTAEDEGVFVARASHEGGVHPGTLVRGSAGAQIPWGASEVLRSECEVLTGVAAGFTLAWEPAPRGERPKHSVIVGEEKGQPMYAVRVLDQGRTRFGKLRGDWVACAVPVAGREPWTGEFSVLVARPVVEWKPVEGAAIPDGAWVAAREGERNLHVGRGWIAGALLPGKIGAGFKGLNVAFANQEAALPRCEVLVGCAPGFELVWVEAGAKIPEGAVEAGTQDGETLYVGRAQGSPGRVAASKPDVCVVTSGHDEIAARAPFAILCVRKAK